MMSTNFWLEILNGPQIGDFEGVLVGNCDGEALRRSGGVLVGRSEKVCRLFYQTGPVSGNVWVGCLVGFMDNWMIIDVETKVVGSCARRRPC